MNEASHITVFAGLFGSGKTNLAVNYALALKQMGHEVVLIDMDVINPLFRLSELKEMLSQAGIALYTPSYAGTNVDIPVLPGAMGSMLREKSGKKIVVDLGGDDIGAFALGQYAGELKAAGYQMLYVFNCFRPFSQRGAEAVFGLRTISAAARLPFTAIAANPNLGEETTAETVQTAQNQVRALAVASLLPVAFTAVPEGLSVSEHEVCGRIFPVRIYLNRAGAFRPAG